MAESDIVIETVTIEPSPANTTSDLNCTYTLSNDSGNVAESYYGWYLDGLYNQSEINNSILYSNQTNDGDKWLCSVTLFNGTTNSTTVSSENLTIGDFILPTIYETGTALLPSYYSDEVANVTMNCQDNESGIPLPIVECGSGGYGSQSECTNHYYAYYNLVNPLGGEYNLTMNYTKDLEYTDSLDFFTLGTHNITAFYCEDASGNIATKEVNYAIEVTTRPIPETTGGGGSVEELFDGFLDYGQSVAIFTALSIPGEACKTLRVRNLGNSTIDGYAEVSKNLTADFSWKFTNEDTQETTTQIKLLPGESSLLEICATFNDEFVISEGKFTIVGNGNHELDIVVDRIPAYQIVDAFSGFTGIDGLPAVAAVYLMGIVLLIGMFNVAVTIL